MNATLSLPFDKAQQIMIDQVPHERFLGMRLVEQEYKEGRIVVDLPYSEKLIGDPESGVVGGGAITTLMDAVCGSAVIVKLRELRRIATLDLRIDYLRLAHPGRTVRAQAECYRVTHHIAFVRATAHDGDPQDLVATATGTFIVFEERINLDGLGDGSPS
jgi:uncharacterized protein (TIGR00369 family)